MEKAKILEKPPSYFDITKQRQKTLENVFVSLILEASSEYVVHEF